MSTKTFEVEFQARLANIKQRAEEAGVSLTSICRETGVARATPDRWLANTPNTIKLLDKLEAEVVKAEKAAAANKKQQ